MSGWPFLRRSLAIVVFIYAAHLCRSRRRCLARLPGVHAMSWLAFASLLIGLACVPLLDPVSSRYLSAAARARRVRALRATRDDERRKRETEKLSRAVRLRMFGEGYRPAFGLTGPKSKPPGPSPIPRRPAPNPTKPYTYRT